MNFFKEEPNGTGLYCLKDTKTGFINPFLQPSEAVATRTIAGILKENLDEICKFPEDYELWKVGYFNKKTGAIEPCMEHIANCIDLVPRK